VLGFDLLSPNDKGHPHASVEGAIYPWTIESIPERVENVDGRFRAAFGLRAGCGSFIPPMQESLLAERRGLGNNLAERSGYGRGSRPARLGSSLHVKGEISGNEGLIIDGSVEGLIQLDEQKLMFGATAKVTADIIARELVVVGNVNGNLRAKDRIEIKKDGSVTGDLTTARIMIEDGAYFKGSIEIESSAEKEADTVCSPRRRPPREAQRRQPSRFDLNAFSVR
jgi:cytoskeletal protein CcmA (bactofilin family)